MAVIEWKKCYEIGIATFDDEHHALVGVINDLYTALREKRGDEVLNSLLQHLVEYTQKHFEHEEENMDKFQFPAAEEHKHAHALLKQRIVDFQQQLSSGKTGISKEIMGFLREWLLDHIVEIDKDFARFLLDKSVYDCGPPAI